MDSQCADTDRLDAFCCAPYIKFLPNTKCKAMTPSYNADIPGMYCFTYLKRITLMCDSSHTIPLRNSSSGYLVPRHTMPSFENVWIIERNSVYMKRLVLTG